MMRPTARQLLIAAVSLIVVLAAAFIAASATQHEPIFSLSNDIAESQRLDLNRTFFTAWAAILLIIPALCAFPFRSSSPSAAGYWLAFWTAGFLAFAVHFYWGVVVIFGGHWSRIAHTTRVSAPVVDTVFTIWWGLDVLLAWTVRTRKLLIEIERTIVYLLAIALFFAGSALEGEITPGRALGFLLGGAVVISLIARLVRRPATYRTPTPPSSTPDPYAR